jgi:hypothetical protein
VGLTNGYGIPDGRVLAGLRFAWAPHARRRPPPDLDGDGVLDESDRCPREIGPPDNDGCPEADRDRDGVIDRLDRCPAEIGVPDNAGCPDSDGDGDGVVDRLDHCRERAGPPSNGGCPVPDRDGDDIPDERDRCPDQAGVPYNDGCPDVDSDGDGLIDRLDRCPFESEVWNGRDDDDGCPDAGAPWIEYDGRQILLRRPLAFRPDGELEARSLPLLDVIAKLMGAHPEIRRFRIEGHSDDTGAATERLERSAREAATVRRVLIERAGVDPARLTAQGYGSSRPLVEGKSPAARARNHRIEIHVAEELK